MRNTLEWLAILCISIGRRKCDYSELGIEYCCSFDDDECQANINYWQWSKENEPDWTKAGIQPFVHSSAYIWTQTMDELSTIQTIAVTGITNNDVISIDYFNLNIDDIIMVYFVRPQKAPSPLDKINLPVGNWVEQYAIPCNKRGRCCANSDPCDGNIKITTTIGSTMPLTAIDNIQINNGCGNKTTTTMHTTQSTITTTQSTITTTQTETTPTTETSSSSMATTPTTEANSSSMATTTETNSSSMTTTTTEANSSSMTTTTTETNSSSMVTTPTGNYSTATSTDSSSTVTTPSSSKETTSPTSASTSAETTSSVTSYTSNPSQRTTPYLTTTTAPDKPAVITLMVLLLTVLCTLMLLLVCIAIAQDVLKWRIRRVKSR